MSSEDFWGSDADETPADWCQKKAVPAKDYCCDQVCLSSLCERGWQPLLITGFLRDLLIRHFGEATNIEQPDLRQYLWQDSEKSGILIEGVYKWVGGQTGKRPAVLLKRNSYAVMEYALNNFLGVAGGDLQTQNYGVFWVGSHSLFCLHGTGASVELLATEVQRALTAFSPVIRQYLGLKKFMVTEVGAIGEVEEAKEHYAVPITVGWCFEERWALQQESLPLRRLTLSGLLGL